MNQEILNKYETWKEKAVKDKDLQPELLALAGQEDRIEDAFYRDLEFGTAGLRGVIGAGTYRMNVYTVGKASQGLANYVKENFEKKDWRIAISYDSRIKSDLFAQTAAGIFAKNGIEVYIYDTLMPVPCLSYATRALKCAAGVMVTASHNPSKYNGYKVYGSDGCQITTEAADAILGEIEKLDFFRDIQFGDFADEMAAGKIQYVPTKVYEDFLQEVKNQSVLSEKDQIDKNVAMVYTPLNGSGLKPVTQILRECGYNNITLVEEQKNPDGNFPTCPYPNPEIFEAMKLGMEYAKKNQADLLLATDPDADRMGIAVANEAGEYVLLSGNETACLLLNYIMERRTANHTMPKNPVVVKSLVSIDLADAIANHYGAECINVLTGFKFIGEQIAKLEKADRASDFVFGFEESYGYLSGTYVRDKDAVDAAFLICEMFSFYKAQGVSLLQKLNEIFETYGFYKNSTMSFEFEGISGVEKMREVMDFFRTGDVTFEGYEVLKKVDYQEGIDGLPKANVIKFYLSKNASVVVRPSGTEPKVKIYLSVCGTSKEDAAKQTEVLAQIAKVMEK